MHKTRVRALAGATILGLVIAAGAVSGSAAADPPPLVWTDAPGFPVVEGAYTVSFLTAETTEDPFGMGYTYADVLPLWLPQFTNTSDETLVVGLGIDLGNEGDVEPLWESDSWGIFSEEGLHPGFRMEIASGESMTQLGTSGLPRWPGHTGAIYLLDESQDPVQVTEIARYTTPGGFVPIHMDRPLPDSQYLPQIGEQLTVTGPSGGAQIFPGLTGVATAGGLTPGETVELWIAPNFDFFFFHLLGAVLPSEAQKVGAGVVKADGTLSATFGLPADLELNVDGFGAEVATPFQLVAGVRSEDYWPAGTWGGFDVLPLTGLESATADVAEGEQSVGLEVGSSLIELGSLDGLPAMTFTATANATGPSISGFTLAGASALFYHLSASAPLTGPVELCISYDPLDIPGPPPHLYHYVEVSPGVHEWIDITATAEIGQVCGTTSSFSPFALGSPVFDFTGFFDPVSMDGPNVAKAGQAIPVKFSLAGGQGLGVVTSATFVTDGTVANPTGEMLDAATAGQSGLSYDPRTDVYTYVWKTQKTWASKTGKFVLTLSDGSEHSFRVSFKK